MTISAPQSQPSALLLLLLDSRAPAGANAHSAGMEAAVTAGWVNESADVEAFCRGKLRTSGLVAATFAAAACRLATPIGLGRSAARPADADAAQRPTPAERDAWRELDDEFEARTASEALRNASRQLGAGLRRLLRATLPELTPELDAGWLGLPAPAPHHPLVLGAACALAGATPVIAARAAALNICTAPASAAVRLLGLDPYAVHALLAQLTPDIDEVAELATEAAAATSVAEFAAGCAITLDLLAEIQIRSEVRLFAS